MLSLKMRLTQVLEYSMRKKVKVAVNVRIEEGRDFFLAQNECLWFGKNNLRENEEEKHETY